MRPDIDLRGYLATRGAAILLPLSLLLLTAFAALGGLLQPSFMPEKTSDAEMTLMVLSLPLSLILPVVAVLITAGDWSDRSIQNTFLQRPGRLGVLASKVLAAIAVCLILIALSIGLAAAATWIGGELMGEGSVFSTFGEGLSMFLLTTLATVLFALAMGVLLQSTVVALVVAIGVPFVISTAAAIIAAFGSELLQDIVRAVDLTTAASTLAVGEAGAFELLPLLLMVILPAALGTRRWALREVG